MFEFYKDIGTYDDRVVGRYDDTTDGKKMVSTAAVSDGSQPYETAFAHPEYHGGKWVIVEAYDTKEAAAVGHDKWVKIMTEGPLPDELRDCCNAGVAQLAQSFGSEMVFPRCKGV